MEETWKLHQESGLLVSNEGKVLIPKSYHYNEHITNGWENDKGYLYVKYKGKCYSVHRLVADCFIENTNNYNEVNHKDENKQNNCVENLEWCDRKYNCNYGTRLDKISKQVYQYDKDLNLIAIYPSTRECEKNGFDSRHISKCCLHKPKHNTHKGFIWSYEEIEKPQAS